MKIGLTFIFFKLTVILIGLFYCAERFGRLPDGIWDWRSRLGVPLSTARFP
jgi:hypothetical protein